MRDRKEMYKETDRQEYKQAERQVRRYWQKETRMQRGIETSNKQKERQRLKHGHIQAERHTGRGPGP
jgi:hypothetical protein